LPSLTYASDVIQKPIYVNGTPIQAPTITHNNYQMVPAVWFSNLSANVNWSTRYQSVSVSNGQLVIGYPIGQRYTDYDLQGRNEWQRDYLNTTSFIHEGRAYIPLAYTARMLGMQVNYDADSQRTSIENAAITHTSIHSSKTDEAYWLYKITEAEAGGESYMGKVAVAASILNRVNSPDWPNSIDETIFHVSEFNGVSYYQYSPVLDQRIYDANPSKDTIKAVQAAQNGEDPSKGAVVFYNPKKTDNTWVRSKEVTVKIGNHVFAK
jgi:hypothetical protein